MFNMSYVLYMYFFQSLKLGWFTRYRIVCEPVGDGPESLDYAWKVCYAYFIIKVIDLLDTVCFYKVI